MGEFIPAVAHCRLQGIANSPTSAALSKATTLIYYKIFECATQFFSLQKRKMCYNKQGQKNAWAISSAGRAPGSQSGGQGFDPPMVHHTVKRSKHRSVSALQRKLHYVCSFFLLNCDPLRWARSLFFHFLFSIQTHLVGLRFGSCPQN